MQADLFCRVVDNYGDIGVTWRLARQLRQEHGWDVRLWVDTLSSFARIEPRVRLELASQEIDGIRIVHWTTPAPDVQPMPVAIAAFSCGLPETYVTRMRETRSLWINLEYLSAEPWVEGFHALPSLRADGLSCHFFFPGFTCQTGGLLREASLLATRDAWQRDRPRQRAFLSRLGVPPEALVSWSGCADAVTDIGGGLCARLISLFCYPQAPTDALVEALQHAPHPTILLVPEGIAPTLQAGLQGNLWIVRIAFLPQPDYDRVLWTADLNFVRGEDSVVRALWAGKPLVWHIYPQTEDTHLVKLQAWLSRVGLPRPAQDLIRAWNSQDGTPAPGKSLMQALSTADMINWGQRAEQLCLEQASMPDLVMNLDQFCRSKCQQNTLSPERLK